MSEWIKRVMNNSADTLFKEYIDAWNDRDTFELGRMFHDNVTLRDWEVEVTGRDSVIGANENIWKAIPDIKIRIKHTAFNPDTKKIFGRIQVYSVKENFTINVIDVVTLEGGKIIQVSAYKQ